MASLSAELLIGMPGVQPGRGPRRARYSPQSSSYPPYPLKTVGRSTARTGRIQARGRQRPDPGPGLVPLPAGPISQVRRCGCGPAAAFHTDAGAAVLKDAPGFAKIAFYGLVELAAFGPAMTVGRASMPVKGRAGLGGVERGDRPESLVPSGDVAGPGRVAWAGRARPVHTRWQWWKRVARALSREVGDGGTGWQQESFRR